MAWTKSITAITEYQWFNGQRLFKVSMSCASDASASGDININSLAQSSLGNDLSKIGRFEYGILYALEYIPGAGGAAPSTQGTITLDNENGTNFFSEQVADADVGEWFDGMVDSGFGVPISNIIFACTTLGNEDTAVFNFWILK